MKEINEEECDCGYIVTDDSGEKIAHFDKLEDAELFTSKKFIHNAREYFEDDMTEKEPHIPQNLYNVFSEDNPNSILSSFDDLSLALNYADRYSQEELVTTTLKDEDGHKLTSFVVKNMKKLETFSVGDLCYRMSYNEIVSSRVIEVIPGNDDEDTVFRLEDGVLYQECGDTISLYESIDALVKDLVYDFNNQNASEKDLQELFDDLKIN